MFFRKPPALAEVIARALEPLGGKVKVAFVFGSVARANESAHSDVDVMVIGDAGFGEVLQLLYPVQAELGREINPKVFTEDEWKSKVAAGDGFLRDVLSKPKLFLIGGPDELGCLSSARLYAHPTSPMDITVTGFPTCSHAARSNIACVITRDPTGVITGAVAASNAAASTALRMSAPESSNARPR